MACRRVQTHGTTTSRAGRKKKDDEESEEISIRELYSRVVGEGGVAPDYFLDKMTFAEVRYFLEGLARRSREGWEQARIISYIIAQVNSTKQLERTDVLRFPWDVADEAGDNKAKVTDADAERLRAAAKAIEQQYNT